MQRILSLIILIIGLIDIAIGLSFLVNPVWAGGEFGVSGGREGLSAIRGDFTAFFVVGGGALVWGAWRMRGDVLLVALALFGVAFIGRLVNVFDVGTYEGWWIPMIVEAAHVVLCLAGRQYFERPDRNPLLGQI